MIFIENIYLLIAKYFYHLYLKVIDLKLIIILLML